MRKKALITGVSSGLGAGLAENLLGAGWEVYGISRRKPEFPPGQPYHHQSTDLSHLEGIASSIYHFLSGAERLDLVILNAGMLGAVRDLRESDLESLRRTMDTNLWANKIILDTVFSLKVPVERVVAISSGASISGERGWSGYGLSKAALNMLIKLYAAEVTDTHFLSLAPGLIQSAMQEYLNTIPDPGRFPVIKRLRQARGTDSMPEPAIAARRVLEAMDRFSSKPSGSYVDVRE